MSEPACPACGETEALRGRPVDGDIAVVCEQCGAEWMRGEPHCKRCGRAGGVTALQRMTRHPRGTLLAVIGTREVLLCQDCDGTVVTDALERRLPVPEGYVSRFLFGEVEDTPSPAPGRATKTRRTERTVSQRVELPAPAAAPEKPALSDPTLRQATEAFLTDSGGSADSLTMLLLGGRLGSTTRLSRLDTEEVAADIAAWVTETFGSRAAQRNQAVDTLRQAVAHWRAQGWLTRDLAERLD